jgi:hypothetical protein
MDLQSLNEPLAALLTWALTMGLRRWFPDAWEGLGSRRVKLIGVALVAVSLAVIAGFAQGLAWPEIVRLSMSALAGSVLVRQTTKPDRLMYGDIELPDSVNIRTKPPMPHYD